MKRLISLCFLALSFFLGLGLQSAQAVEFTEPGRVYDAQGRYQGRMEANGRMYDDRGRYLGREDHNSRRYDARGRYQGQTR